MAARSKDQLTQIVQAAKLEAAANDLGEYIADGVVGREAVVRFERGVLTYPLDPR